MQVQHAILMASAIDLGVPAPDMTGLWQAAAEEERREALFGQFAHMFM